MHKTELTFEALAEALIESSAFISQTRKILLKKHNIDVGRDLILNRIKEWEMGEFVDDIRRGLVETTLSRTFQKAIQEGDNTCMFWVLNKYGHHADFLSSAETDTESKRGWRVLLEHVKATIEPETGEESSREHSSP